MNILEIKNNLIKLSYSNDETPALGRFITLNGNDKSYVAQFVNLKSDLSNNFAIAKLLFTFNSEGIVDNYDGSIPPINSEISPLAAGELLELLPVETPIKIGNLAQQKEMLNLDVSIFEGNLTVFGEKDSHKLTFISNCVKQLFRMKEKSVIIDDSNLFEDYPRLKLGIDYKLPLNSKMIDYLFEYELDEVEAETKAVIQDIFYAVQQYIKTLDFEFLPIDNFVDVVTKQYKESQMPELALLKNKLLKYRDAGIFANTKEEVTALNQAVDKKNCIIIDIKDINDALQKEIISYIHNILDATNKYTYLFVQLNDDNSDKKLLKQIINHNHIFTTMLVSSTYKYAKELYQHAQNMLLFSPLSIINEFASYNTFLNKLNPSECVVCGKLTQGIPFIVEMTDIDTGLTIDDVLGDKYQFVPQQDISEVSEISEPEPSANPFQESPLIEQEIINEEPEMTEDEEAESSEEDIIEPDITDKEPEDDNIIKPVDNLLDDNNNDEYETSSEDEIYEDDDIEETEDEQHPTESYIEEVSDNDYQNQDLHDLPPVVPVYPADENKETATDETGTEFKQGDSITHPRYGKGFVEKIIKYGNKTLCSIAFDNVGRRLLDPSISELTKI